MQQLLRGLQHALTVSFCMPLQVVHRDYRQLNSWNPSQWICICMSEFRNGMSVCRLFPRLHFKEKARSTGISLIAALSVHVSIEGLDKYNTLGLSFFFVFKMLSRSSVASSHHRYVHQKNHLHRRYTVTNRYFKFLLLRTFFSYYCVLRCSLECGAWLLQTLPVYF